MGDNPHFLDNTDHMSRYGEHHARSEYNSDAPLQNLPKFIGKEGVKAVGKMLLSLPRPYYLAVPAACILLLLYIFAFRDPSPAYVPLPPSPVLNSSPSAGPALSDTPPTHSAGNATLGVSILPIEVSDSRTMR